VGHLQDGDANFAARNDSPVLTVWGGSPRVNCDVLMLLPAIAPNYRLNWAPCFRAICLRMQICPLHQASQPHRQLSVTELFPEIAIPRRAAVGNYQKAWPVSVWHSAQMIFKVRFFFFLSFITGLCDNQRSLHFWTSFYCERIHAKSVLDFGLSESVGGAD
jgi:hypothetical protein